MIAPFEAAAPLLILAATTTILLAAIAIKRHFAASTAIAAIGLLAATASTMPAIHAAGPAPMQALFTYNALSLGFAGLISLTALAVLVLAAGYFAGGIKLPREEFPLLILIATTGAVALALSASFITLFLGLETMSLAMIGMIAYPRYRPDAEEAGLKYLVLSGMSSALVLFGIALVELATNHLQFLPVLAASMAGTPIMLAALALIGVGAGFKLSVVPFHIWVPDIYAGAPAPAAAYVATIPKIAVLAVIIRILDLPGVTLSHGTIIAVTVVAILSMAIGNLLALMQENLKRILGYSSIAHLGYLLVALLAASAIGRTGIVFYIVTYALTMIGAFGIIGLLSRATASTDLDQVSDLHGLFWTRPLIAAIMTLVLLSLAGIPPAIGFIAKMYIMAAGVDANLRILTGTLVVTSVIGLFYYLRIIIVMSLKPLDHAPISGIPPSTTATIPLTGWVTMATIGALILGFGLAPESLISALKILVR